MNRVSDRKIPALNTALDTNAVLDLIHGALRANGISVELIELKIYSVLYRPGERCRILYKLKFRHPQTGRFSRQLLSAHLPRINENEQPIPPELVGRYEATMAKHRVIPVSILNIPKPRMVIYPFPMDVSLPWLFDVLDASIMRDRMKRRWPQNNMRIQKVSAQLLGYTPQARASLLYKLIGEAKGEGLTEEKWLIGKIHAFKQAAKRFADGWALSRASGSRVNLATPMGYIGSLNLSLQEKADGSRLSDFVDLDSFPSLMRNTARAISCIHSLSVPVSTIRTPQKEAGVVHRWANVLRAICQSQKKRIDRLGNRLAAEIEGNTVLSSPVHGDFHHTNILVNNEHVTLIDFDELAYGDPCLDVGRLLASLRVPALRTSGNPSAYVEAQEAFLDEYLACRSVDKRKIRLFEAVSLMISAATPFRLQRAGWEEQTEIMLDESEKTLQKAKGGSLTKTMNVANKQFINSDERSDWAKDETYMLAIFDPHIRERYGAELISCRLTSERRNKHAHRIRYSLSGWKGDQKWKLSVNCLIRNGSGRSLYQRLESLRLATDGKSDILKPPRPIAYVSPLSILILEEPLGKRLSSMIGTSAASQVARRFGRALSLFHKTRLDINKASAVKDEIFALHRLTDDLKVVSPGSYTQARETLARLDGTSRNITPRIAPILHKLHPNHIFFADDRVCLAEVEDITLSHPFIDVGNFVARLMLMGIRDGRIKEVEEVSNNFYEAYMAAGALGDNNIRWFEACALLRLACLQAKRDSTKTNAEVLIEKAAARLNQSY